MSAVELRPVRVHEVDAVLQLWKKAAEVPTATDDRAGVEALLSRDSEALLLAVAGEEIVGTVIAGWDGWRGNLYRLAVLPEFRRQGIGRALVDEAERRLLARGVRRVHAGVLHQYQQAPAFWEAAGYRFDERIARHTKMLG